MSINMSESPTREESSPTIDLGFAIQMLQLPSEPAESKRKTKKHSLLEVTKAKQTKLQQQAKRLITADKVFHPDFLAVVSQLALTTQVAKLEVNPSSKASLSRALASNLVLKIKCEATDGAIPRASSVDSDHLPLDGLTRNQRNKLKQTLIKSKQAADDPLEFSYQVGLKNLLQDCGEAGKQTKKRAKK